MTYVCENCKLEFEAEEAVVCPRCSSKKISRKKKFSKQAEKTQTEKRQFFHKPINVREGKEGWMEFHRAEIKNCSNCGNAEFEIDWKHKEKICKKCGSIYKMLRRVI